MYVLVQETTDKYKGMPEAVFSDHYEGEKFYNALPQSLKDAYRPVVIAQSFPLFFIWTWDRKDHSNKDKYNVQLTDAAGVDAYLKTVKRDREWEKESDDDQYFYLGIIWGDGISYGLRQQLKMPVEPYDLHSMFDHEHIIGDVLAEMKSEGIRRSLLRRMRNGEKIYKRFRKRANRFKRLMERSRAAPLSDSGTKTLKRLSQWLRRHHAQYETVWKAA